MREYGLQLYSIRNAITENYHDALRQVAEMGYKMAELWVPARKSFAAGWMNLVYVYRAHTPRRLILRRTC